MKEGGKRSEMKAKSEWFIKEWKKRKARKSGALELYSLLSVMTWFNQVSVYITTEKDKYVRKQTLSLQVGNLPIFFFFFF